MASLEAQEPLVWNHHGDGSGSIGHLINPISHGGGHDAEMRRRVSSFSLQVTTRVGGFCPPSPHPPLLRHPPNPKHHPLPSTTNQPLSCSLGPPAVGTLFCRNPCRLHITMTHFPRVAPPSPPCGISVLHLFAAWY